MAAIIDLTSDDAEHHTTRPRDATPILYVSTLPISLRAYLQTIKNSLNSLVCPSCRAPLPRSRGDPTIVNVLAKRSFAHCLSCASSWCLACGASCSLQNGLPSCVLGRAWSLSILLTSIEPKWNALVDGDRVQTVAVEPKKPKLTKMQQKEKARMPILPLWRGDDAAVVKISQSDSEVAGVFELLRTLLINSHADVGQLLRQSPFIMLVVRYLRNDCIENINDRPILYMTLLALLSTMAEQEHLSGLLSTVYYCNPKDSVSDRNGGEPDAKRLKADASISDLLDTLDIQAEIYLRCLPASSNQTSIVDICERIRSLCQIIHAESNQVILVDDDAVKQSYENVMREFVFNYITILEPMNLAGYAFTQQLNALHSTAKRTLVIAKELASLSTSLPCNKDAAIFIRVDEERYDCIKVLISGPAGTPYHNGLFEFDFFLPASYPQVPPQVLFKTTDNSRVRFNPNLYNCGKVCLSLLGITFVNVIIVGTWAGDPWIANTSTILQVLISIQSLILVDRPYFNEPGFGEPCDSSKSNAYSKNIRKETVVVAMTKMLNKPPKAFEETVITHFKVKKDEIQEQLNSWVALDPTLKTSAKTLCSLLDKI